MTRTDVQRILQYVDLTAPKVAAGKNVADADATPKSSTLRPCSGNPTFIGYLEKRYRVP